MYSFKELLDHYNYLLQKKATIVGFLSMEVISKETKMSYVEDLERCQVEIVKLEKTVFDSNSNYRIKKFNL